MTLFTGEVATVNDNRDARRPYAHAGQRLRLKILLLAESTEDQGELDRLLDDDSSRTCSTVLVVGETVLRRSRELAVCVGRSRVRTLYASTGNTVTVYVTAGYYNIDSVVRPRFLVIFEGIQNQIKRNLHRRYQVLVLTCTCSLTD